MALFIIWLSLFLIWLYGLFFVYSERFFFTENPSEKEITTEEREFTSSDDLPSFTEEQMFASSEDSPSFVAKTQNADKNYFPSPKRLAIRDIERRGIGYKTGYATFEALFGSYQPVGSFVPLLDLRAHHLYEDHYAANAGLIGRWILDSPCVILGLNAYYDFREGALGNYQGFGFGVELLSRTCDFRINGYFPLSEHLRIQRCVCDHYNGPYFILSQTKEFSLYGFNAELGCRFYDSSAFMLYGAIGPYYLTSQPHVDTWGARARLRFQYNDYIALELSTSYDSLFKSVYQGEITLSWPLYQMGSKNKRGRSRCLTDRFLYQPAQRFEIIPLKERHRSEKNF